MNARTFKNTLAAAVITASTFLALGAGASAAGSATYSLSGSGSSHVQNSTFSVVITETSAEAVAGVQADLTYDASKLECVTIDAAGSAFVQGYPSSCSGGRVSIARTTQGTTVTGSQRVAAVVFKTLGNSGSTTITMNNSSSIQNAAVNDIWNHASVAASYTLTAPAVTPNPAPTPMPSPAPKSTTPAAPAATTSRTPAAPANTAPAAQTPAVPAAPAAPAAPSNDVLGAETKTETPAAPVDAKKDESTPVAKKGSIWKVLAGIALATFVVLGSVVAFRAINAESAAPASKPSKKARS